jgi:hypothetical protein
MFPRTSQSSDLHSEKYKGRPDYSDRSFSFVLQGVEKSDQLLFFLVRKFHLEALVAELAEFGRVLPCAIVKVRRDAANPRRIRPLIRFTPLHNPGSKRLPGSVV